MKLKAKLDNNHGLVPSVTPTPRKSIHLKKTRPNMKGKHKIRMGHESPDIYEGFDDVKGVKWVCPTCRRSCRVVGYCIDCASGKQHKRPDAATKVETKEKLAKKAPLESAKKAMRFKKKR